MFRIILEVNLEKMVDMIFPLSFSENVGGCLNIARDLSLLQNFELLGHVAAVSAVTLQCVVTADKHNVNQKWRTHWTLADYDSVPMG
jgi:hypothetical protein